MGSFSYTCALSDLPIESGDKVRYLLLSKSPYKQSICTMHGAWFPRTFPIKAEYNDYGSVENVEDGLGKELWMEGLKVDLVSVGLGDNTFHDVPTSINMSFDHMLDAVVEHRIKVKRTCDLADQYNKRKNLYKTKTPVGIPTMQRVRKLLKRNGFKVVDQGFSDEGYMVDKLKYGKIRVRASLTGVNWHKDEEFLKLIQPYFSEYVSVIVAGQDSNKAELLVYPKPGTKDWHNAHSYSAKKTLLVDHAMIREDVWQEIINTPLKNFYSDNVDTIQDYYLAITETYLKYQEFLEEYYKECESKSYVAFRPTSIECKFRSLMKSEEWKNNPVVDWLIRGDIPFVIGIAEHWMLFLDKKLPLDEVKSVLYDMAEFIYVMNYMLNLRFYWQPSNSCGPQIGLWKHQKQFLKSLLKISNNSICVKRDSKGRFCK